MDQDNPNGFVESERGIILNEPLPEERHSPTEPALKPPKKHEKKIVGFLLFLLVAGAVAFAATQIDYTAISDTIAGNGYEAPEELSAIIDELDLTDAGMRILKATRPELQEADDFDNNCVMDSQNAAVLGCYNNSHIYVYNIQRSELDGIRQATLAHELLHAIWARMSSTERDELSAPLKQVYESNEQIKKNMEHYDTTNPDDELHARVGTQVDPEQLPEILRNHYAKYFKDHAKIVGYYTKYESVFEAISKEMETLKANIEAHRKQLSILQQSYNQKHSQFQSDLADYNERRRQPNGYASETEFRAAYEALVDQQKQINADYSTLIAYYKETNDLINEYNRKAVYANDLQQSMDSKSVKEPAGV